jgi:hypothetical protein
LFKAAYQVRRELGEGLQLRPVVVLREDIFSQLDDHDFNKMDEMTVRLRWTTAARDHTDVSLRALVSQRIRSHYK